MPDFSRKKKDPKFPYMDNLKVDSRLVGFPTVLIPFAEKDSSGRIDMYSSHQGQALVVDGCEFPQIFTGFENDLKNYWIDPSKRNQDIQVLAAIPKYRPMGGDYHIAETPSITIIYLGQDDGLIGYCTLERYFRGTDGYGYQNIWHHNHMTWAPNSYVSKDTVLSRCPAIKGEKVMFGVNANVAYMTLPDTIQDAFPISESLAEKLTTTAVYKMTIPVNPNYHPLNTYGDDVTYKFMPDIGEYVNPDTGIVFAARPINMATFPSDTFGSQMNEVQGMHDVIYRIPPGSKIVDITVHEPPKQSSGNHQVYAQTSKYTEGLREYYKSILAVWKEHRTRYKCTHEMNTLITEAITRLSAMGEKKIAGSFPFRARTRLVNRSEQPIEFMQIDITYVYKRKFSEGFKLTARHGDKGVACRVYKDEDMPVDEQGVRADIVIDPGATIKRMNLGQLAESALNRVSEFVKRKLTEVYATDPKAAAYMLLDYYNDVNPNYANLIRSIKDTDHKLIQHVAEAIADKIYLNVPPFLETTYQDDFFTKLQEKWNVPVSRVTYTLLSEDGDKRYTYTSEEPVCIGSKYLMLLCKLPEPSSPGVARLSHTGAPIKDPSSEKRQSSISRSPVRMGEDELRNRAMDVDTKIDTRFMALQSGSPLGVAVATETLMTAEHPTAIYEMPISDEDLANTNSPTVLMHHIFATMGIESKQAVAGPQDFPHFIMANQGSMGDPLEEDEFDDGDDLDEDFE